MNLLIILAAAFVVSVILRLWFSYLDQKDRVMTLELEREGLLKEKEYFGKLIKQAQIVTYEWGAAKKQQEEFESAIDECPSLGKLLKVKPKKKVGKKKK